LSKKPGGGGGGGGGGGILGFQGCTLLAGWIGNTSIWKRTFFKILLTPLELAVPGSWPLIPFPLSSWSKSVASSSDGSGFSFVKLNFFFVTGFSPRLRNFTARGVFKDSCECLLDLSKAGAQDSPTSSSP
jgi:hypothetical protein